MGKSTLPYLSQMEKHKQLDELEKGKIYPVTIMLDMDDGKFSGAKWLAFQSWPDELPFKGWQLDTAEKFWVEHNDLVLPIGKGNTPNKALEDLKVKAKKFYESW